MKKFFFAGLLIVHFTFNSSAQKFKSMDAFSIMGQANVYPDHVHTDGNNDVLVGGHFVGVADFDPGSESFELSSSSTIRSPFVQKTNPNGELIWAKHWETNGRIIAIGSDLDDAVIVVGTYSTSIDLDPNDNAVTVTPETGSSAVFVVKLDEDGEYVWGYSTSTWYDPAITIYTAAVDNLGNSYLAGEVSDTVDFDPGSGQLYLPTGTNLGSDQAFLVKIDNTGKFAWAANVESDQVSSGLNLATDNNQNVFMSGGFRGTIKPDPIKNPSLQIGSTSPGDHAYLVKYGPDGTVLWAKGFSTGGVDPTALAADKKGDVFFAGVLSGYVDINPGPDTLRVTGNYNGFVVKLDPLGDFIWAEALLGTPQIFVYQLAVSEEGEVTLGGELKFRIDTTLSGDVVNLSNQGQVRDDHFLVELTTDGRFSWSSRITGTSFHDLEDVTYSKHGQLTAVGNFTRNIEFRSGSKKDTLFDPTYRAGYVCSYSLNSVGFDESLAQQNIRVYPNPSQGLVNIDWQNSNEELLELEVVDLQGKTIYQKTLYASEELDLSSVNAGVYQLRLHSKSGFHQVIKLVLE